MAIIGIYTVRYSASEKRHVVSVIRSMRSSNIHNPAAWLPAALYNSLLNADKQDAYVSTAPSYEYDDFMLSASELLHERMEKLKQGIPLSETRYMGGGFS